jgi:hypothetical protein
MNNGKKKRDGDVVINVPTRLRYYIDSISILLTGLITALAIYYAFGLIS